MKKLNKLAKRTHNGNLRTLRVADHCIDFASNDYLGLARSQNLFFSVLKEWKKQKLPMNGLGSTGSRLLTGNSLYAEQLEQEIAAFHGYEAGLLFSSGYMANIGLLSAIVESEDAFFFDAHIHASMRDGIRLSRASSYPFRHCDLEHLEKRLKNTACRGTRWILIESIYSSDGVAAPLSAIAQLAKHYGALLIVDEAHALGVFGPEGRGLIAENGLTRDLFAQVTTFGKALGVHGAIVLGSKMLKKYLINFAHSCIYTTALPFLSLAAIRCSYKQLVQCARERHHLHQLIQLFQKSFPSPSRSPIHSVPVKGNWAVRRVAEQLLQDGFDVRPLMSPTVQRRHESLRICLHAFNTKEQVTALIERIHHYV